MANEYHLCHLNIGPAKGPLHSPVMAGFVEKLDEMNQLAYQSPGFVWHLIIDINNPDDLALYGEPGLLFNMSVWRSIEDLKNYVYKSDHAKVMRLRAQWFGELDTYSYVLWWKPDNDLPTLEEAKAKLAYLNLHGPSQEAFVFKSPYPPPSHANAGALVTVV